MPYLGVPRQMASSLFRLGGSSRPCLGITLPRSPCSGWNGSPGPKYLQYPVNPFLGAGIWLANAGPEILAPGRHPQGFHYLTGVVLPPVRRPFALGNPFVAGTIYLAGVMKTPVRRPILGSYLCNAEANHRAIQYFCRGPLGPGCIVTT